MAWSDLTALLGVSFTNMQTSGIPLKAGQSHTTSNELMTKAGVIAKYSVNEAKPSLLAKGSLDIVVKQDLVALGECGAGTYDYFYGDLFKVTANAGKVAYTITGLSASEVVNIIYNSNIIHVAQANGSGTATGSFFFPYDGSNRFITFDSTSY